MAPIGFFFLGLVPTALAPGAVWGGPPPLILSSAQDRYDLAGHLEILEDKNQEWTVDDVAGPRLSNRFQPAGPSTISLGLSQSAYWLRFTLAASAQDGPNIHQPNRWLLEIGYPHIESVHFFENQSADPATWRAWDISEIRDHRARTSLFRRLVVRIPDVDARPTTFYLRIASPTAMLLPLTVTTDSAYLEISNRRTLWFGFYFGILLVMLFYNLFLFFSLGDRSYLWYVFYVFFLGWYFLGINGVIVDHLVHVPYRTGLRFILAFLGLALVGTALFARSFLMTRRTAPAMDKLLQVYMGTAAALAASAPFAGYALLNQCFSLMGLVAPVVVVSAAVVCWRKGFRPARYFLMAWAIYGLGGLTYALTFRGLLPFSLWTYYGFQAGSALEVTLLSFALADRIKTLRREREALEISQKVYRELSITDGLTGLYNVRYFNGRITEEVVRAQREGQPLSLLMLDVDDFKHYNDTFGHPEGDWVLVRLARIISESVRSYDSACRYGGEEFCVILPGAEVKEAMAIAERIRRRFAKEDFLAEDRKRPMRVTVSVGVAQLLDGETVQGLVKRSDKAMYEAKSSGKNRTVLSASPGLLP